MTEHVAWPIRSLALVLGFLLLVAALLVGLTAPFSDIVGESRYALPAAIHGLLSFLYVVVGTIGLYLAWRLLAGRIRAFPDLQLAAVVNAGLSALTILFGNWIYIHYRAPGPGSPRSFFLEHAPDVHRVWFEFKEFVALFTLPLSVAAAYILVVSGSGLLESRRLRSIVAILMALSFFYLCLAFGLGAAVTKLKSI